MSKILTIIEKIKLIYNRVKDGNERLDAYCSFRDIPELSTQDKPDFVLPQEYTDLHKEFDWFRISWCDFLASRNTKMSTVDEYKEALTNWEYSTGYYPFAKDAGGNIFTFSPHDQKIWMFGMDYFDEPPTHIAESFDAFMNDCVLGNRYLEFLSMEDDYFYAFLVEQGWVQE